MVLYIVWGGSVGGTRFGVLCLFLRLTLLGGMVFCFAIRSGLEFGLLVGD